MPPKATRAAKSTAKPAPAEESTEPAATPTPKKAKAVRSQPAPAAPAADDSADRAEEATGADEVVAGNRAERRAKGRGKSGAQVPGGRGKVSGGHGPAHTQRNWANRRTG